MVATWAADTCDLMSTAATFGYASWGTSPAERIMIGSGCPAYSAIRSSRLIPFPSGSNWSRMTKPNSSSRSNCSASRKLRAGHNFDSAGERRADDADQIFVVFDTQQPRHNGARAYFARISQAEQNFIACGLGKLGDAEHRGRSIHSQQLDIKNRTLTRYGVKSDASPHRFGEFARNTEPQAGSLEASRGGSICLREF